MYRFRFEVMVAALAVIFCGGVLGVWFDAVMATLRNESSMQSIYVLICIVCSAALTALAYGMRRNLPNYGGMPPLRDLGLYLRPIVSTAVTACIVVTWSSYLLATIPATSTFQHSALTVARWLDIGILMLCIWWGTRMILEFRRMRAWERRMHPTHTDSRDVTGQKG